MRKVPFINYQAQYREIEAELRPVLDEVIFERSDFVMRDDLRNFEANFAAFVGTKYAVGVKSCTDGLMLSLRACGIGPGHEVITPAHTFVATVAAIHHVGATPILVDVGEDDLTDPIKVQEAITDRTRALLPVHLNGRICDMDTLQELAQKHGLSIVEDAAQALGATYKGRGAGSMGIAGCFSFFPAKLLGCAGDGGAVTTDSPEMRDQLMLLRDHGRQTKNDFALYGFNSRLDNLQAAILDVKLRHLPTWLDRRRRLAAAYHGQLQGLPLELPPPPVEGEIHHDVFQNYVIKNPRRDDLKAFLQERGVETLISWPKPIWENEALALAGGDLEKTRRVCQRVLSLPMNSELTLGDVNYVCQMVREFFES